MNKNKWHLMLCELHFPTIHGKTDDSYSNIETHYLVYDIYDPFTKLSLHQSQSDDEYDSDDSEDTYDSVLSGMNNDIIELKQKYFNLSICFTRYPNYNYAHPAIRNYQNIISNPNYIRAEIGEYIILPTQEAITILKTFWIRIIQKKWKKVFKQQQQIIQERCKLQNLNIRRITGYWPEYCNILPGLKGMLRQLK
jgi:hypothetical protein